MTGQRKMAQVAAFFLLQAGGTLPALKLLSLMYLAEREMLRRYGDTLTGAQLINTNYGPLLLEPLELVCGVKVTSPDECATLVVSLTDNTLSLTNPVIREVLGRQSV